MSKAPATAVGMPDIVQNGAPILRDSAKPVPRADIGTPRIQGIIAGMKAAMDAQKDGIAIAAPQIGQPLRIFVVSGKLLQQADKTYKGGSDDLVFVNPELSRMSRDTREVEEGCLSVRWLYGKVKRSTRVTLKGFDESSQKIERGASGLLAQIFQHEVDHLNGILFIDKARELWEMTPEEIAEHKKD